MPEPLESPAKILSPARPVDLPLLETGGAWSIWVGVVEAMIFPVWVGEGPLAAVHRIPWVEGEGPQAPGSSDGNCPAPEAQ